MNTFIPESSRKKTKTLFSTAIGDKKTAGNIDVIVTKSGQERFVEWYDTTIRDAEGGIAGLLAVGQDITERMKAEEALKDEATRRRILIEQSGDGIVILDQNGGVYDANQRFAEMLGYKPSEILKLHVWDWEYLSSRKQLLEMLRTVDEKGAHFETEHRRKNGSVYDVEISTNGAIFAGQKLVFCVCRDITERIKAEEALRKSEERYRFLAMNAKDLIYRYRLLPKPGFEYVSPAAVEMTGYTPEEH